MFAVPGWSVSADLKPENGGESSGAKTRKRKRAAGQESEEVTRSNVAELYDSIVQGKASGNNSASIATKKLKNGDDSGGSKHNRNEKGKPPKRNGDTHVDSRKTKNDEKRQKRESDRSHAIDPESNQNASSKLAKSTMSGKQKPDGQVKAQLPPPPPAPAKLTPLQASMREKLVSARFRHLNETLYTRPSTEAYELFHDSPEMFDEYHEGFRRQVKVWPENPVDSFLSDIRTRAKIRTPSSKGRPGGGFSAQPPLARTPLTRTMGTCVIADLGCGDARLAESLEADKGKLRLDVKSYDLQSPSPLVTKADIANLPLEDGSVNVAIFCLALMGTNWIDFIEEAYRILHWKGELWIAEIKSRFTSASRGNNNNNKKGPVSHSVGNRRKMPGKKGKAGNGEEADMDPVEDLAVEVDGNEDRRRETDVSAFVEVLKKRGFVLQGGREEAVDLSNKMFVKMHFLKGASPTKGKGVKMQEKPRIKKQGVRWLDNHAGNDDDYEDGGETTAKEASILKPCVYKLR